MKLKKHQAILFVAFTAMLLVGVIGLNTVPFDVKRETHIVETSDGVSIHYNFYYKTGLSQVRPVIVMGHGIIVNKEMMTNYAIELASHDFIVASIDWRGHGHSDGPLGNLSLDLEAVIADIPSKHAMANMSGLGLLGYSMGGWPTYDYAVNHTTVKAWVGVGTTWDGTVSNETNPSNALVIYGQFDEAFAMDRLKAAMVNLTSSISSPDEVQLDHLYGNMNDGTARKLQQVPLADHLTVPWDQTFIASATSWFVETFDGVQPDLSFMVYHQRAIMMFVGLIGLVGTLYCLSLVLAKALKISKESRDEKKMEDEIFRNNRESLDELLTRTSNLSLFGKYYLYTILLFPTMILPALTALIPLPFTAIITTFVTGLAINILIYTKIILRRKGLSLLSMLKENLVEKPGVWIYSIIIAGYFMTGFTLIIGNNYLGNIPAVVKIPYSIPFIAILFVSVIFYSLFLQKIVMQQVNKRLTGKSETTRIVVNGLVGFVLLFSWNFAMIMTLNVVIDFYFLNMVLILMAPIFLFSSFLGVFLEKSTGSIIPGSLLLSVLLGVLIVTLSPLVGISDMMWLFTSH